MASTNNGNQLITFRYQQEGTAESFNKLFLNILPNGIISGGNLTKVNDNAVIISAGTEILIGDGTVLVHVKLQDDANVIGIDGSKPYVVGNFVWLSTTTNYVTFLAKNLDDIVDNDIIFGRCEYSGGTMEMAFDYTKKSWCSSHYNNDFLFPNSFHTALPSFNVSPMDNAPAGELGFTVNQGHAVIGGRDITLNQTSFTLSNDTSSPLYVLKSVSSGRCDLLCLNRDGNFEYIMGEDGAVDPLTNKPAPQPYPNNMLVLARITLSAGTHTVMRGSFIENVYNNNYMSSSPTLGQRKYSGGNFVTENPHTLYL